MENKKQPVSDVPGTKDLPEMSLQDIRNAVVHDLKTARVLCLLVSEHEDLRNLVIDKLDKKIRQDNKAIETIRNESGTASLLCKAMLDSKLIIDNTADVMQGLWNNHVDRLKHKAEKEDGTGAFGSGH